MRLILAAVAMICRSRALRLASLPKCAPGGAEQFAALSGVYFLGNTLRNNLA
jgi:hypothetical protein